MILLSYIIVSLVCRVNAGPIITHDFPMSQFEKVHTLSNNFLNVLKMVF